MKFITVIILLISAIPLSAQLRISSENSTDPDELVRILIEDEENSVEFRNVRFQGVARSNGTASIGEFDGSDAGIGLQEGIILTTGQIRTAPGPNSSEDASSRLNVSGDNTIRQLLQMTGNITINYDATVLEFDFVPQFSNVSFKYVFASEEYEEYVCKEFNDVFGFFITGPGIISNIDGLDDTRNIAIIPGSDEYVSINTVNEGCWERYFNIWRFRYEYRRCNDVDCDPSNTRFFNRNRGGDLIEYDGYTDVLNATINNLIPYETYTIKLVVADVADDVYDSAVFLEAGSFESFPDSTTLFVEDTSSYSHEIIDIPIRISNDDIDKFITLKGFTAELEFDPELLEPYGGTPEAITDGNLAYIEMDLPSKPQNEDILAKYSFKALYKEDFRISPLNIRNIQPLGLNIPVYADSAEYQLLVDTLVIDIGDHKAKTGDTVAISIFIRGIKARNFDSLYGINADISYEVSVMVPFESSAQGKIDNNRRSTSIFLEYPPKDSLVLDTLWCIATLGKVSYSDIRITDLETVGTYFNLIEDPGSITISNICEEGGERLVRDNGAVELYFNPNPAKNLAKLRFKNIEKGILSIKLVNMEGVFVSELFKDQVEAGRIERFVDLTNISSGNYIIIVQTNSQIYSKMISIHR